MMPMCMCQNHHRCMFCHKRADAYGTICQTCHTLRDLLQLCPQLKMDSSFEQLEHSVFCRQLLS